MHFYYNADVDADSGFVFDADVDIGFNFDINVKVNADVDSELLFQNKCGTPFVLGLLPSTP